MRIVASDHPPWVARALEFDSLDDDRYVGLVRRVIARLVVEHEPGALCITKINNWFDHKWLGFTRSQWGSEREVRPPPFSPKRVVSEGWYSRRSDRSYAPCPEASWRLTKARYIHIWWTGNSDQNQRGALMCYLFDGKTPLETWYTALVAAPDWKRAGVRGLSAKRFDRLAVAVPDAEGIENLRKRPEIFLDANDVDGLRAFEKKYQAEIDGDFGLCWYTGWVFFRLGHITESLRLLERSIAIQPDHHFGYFVLGSACKAAGMAKRAEELFRESLRLRDGWAARHSLAVVFLDQGRVDEGEALLREGVARKPGSRMRLEEFADYLDDIGKTKEADDVRVRASRLRSAKGGKK